MSSSFGETAARRALRENSVAASKAIRNHIDDLPLYLKEKGFISDSHYDSVMSTTHESAASKANRFLGAVEGKVDSGNDAQLGSKWLEAFVRILVTQSIGEFEVAQNIAKVYGKFHSNLVVFMNVNMYISSTVRHADGQSSGYTFFSQIAQGLFAFCACW